MTVTFYFDWVCPWCWIGWRHLQAARAQAPGTRLAWRGFALLPDVPAAGLPYQEFYVRRLGSTAAVAARRAQVAAAGAAAGLVFAFERIDTMPNTQLAHAMFAHAQLVGSDRQCEALCEAIFQAWFVEGRDIGQRACLLDLARGVGLDFSGASGHAALPVTGIYSVPTLAVEGRGQLQGLQSPQQVLDLLGIR
ncbi:MAG: DsbA family protein [Pseudomonadota bacterium]